MAYAYESRHLHRPKVTNTFGKKALVISLICSCQSVDQITGRTWPPDCDLSSDGMMEATALGRAWKDVRIDYLYSSPLKRAYQTAAAISMENRRHPRVIWDEMFVERQCGEVVLRLSRENDDEGTRRFFYGPSRFDRNYVPPGGGESLKMLSARARSGIVELMKRHGRDMEFPPYIPGHWGPGLDVKPPRSNMATTSPEMLPDGIPHLVLLELWMARNTMCLRKWELVKARRMVGHRCQSTQGLRFERVQGWAMLHPVITIMGQHNNENLHPFL